MDYPGRHAAPADDGPARQRRAARVVAGRAVDRVRRVDARRRAALQGRRRGRHADAAHDRQRAVPAAVVVAGWQARRRDAEVPRRRSRESGGFIGAAELVWVPAAGGKATFIASALGRSAPHFTKDTARIFLYGQGEGLVSIRWDGSDPRTHLRVTGARFPEPAPGGPAGAPAGACACRPPAIRRSRRSRTTSSSLPVPFTGEAPTISLADPTAAEFPARKADRRRRTVPELERRRKARSLVDRQLALRLRSRSRASVRRFRQAARRARGDTTPASTGRGRQHAAAGGRGAGGEPARLSARRDARHAPRTPRHAGGHGGVPRTRASSP